MYALADDASAADVDFAVAPGTLTLLNSRDLPGECGREVPGEERNPTGPNFAVSDETSFPSILIGSGRSLPPYGLGRSDRADTTFHNFFAPLPTAPTAAPFVVACVLDGKGS